MSKLASVGGGGLLRTLSFIVALLLATLIVLYPRAIAEDSTSVSHGALVLMLLGMSSAWVYGLGFTPRNRWLRGVFSPWVAWALMAAGAWFVFEG